VVSRTDFHSPTPYGDQVIAASGVGTQPHAVGGVPARDVEQGSDDVGQGTCEVDEGIGVLVCGAAGTGQVPGDLPSLQERTRVAGGTGTR
jgi:hypothetical protein